MLTGVKNYNLKIDYDEEFKWNQFGILNKNGDQIHATGLFGLWKNSILNWLSDTEIEKAKKDRDSADAPKCSIKSQPNSLGKLLWFTGNNICKQNIPICLRQLVLFDKPS